MIKKNFHLFSKDMVIICLIFGILIYYASNANYTRVMSVIYSDNDTIVLQDGLTHQTVTIEEINKSQYSRCRVTCNRNGTEQTQDDVIVKLKWLK